MTASVMITQCFFDTTRLISGARPQAGVCEKGGRTIDTQLQDKCTNYSYYFNLRFSFPLLSSFYLYFYLHPHAHHHRNHDDHDTCFQVLVLNVLWSVTCGRKLHPQQQEFQVTNIKIIINNDKFYRDHHHDHQAVYECIDKITQFVSKAAIFSFLPMLTWVCAP